MRLPDLTIHKSLSSQHRFLKGSYKKYIHPFTEYHPVGQIRFHNKMFRMLCSILHSLLLISTKVLVNYSPLFHSRKWSTLFINVKRTWVLCKILQIFRPGPHHTILICWHWQSVWDNPRTSCYSWNHLCLTSSHDYDFLEKIHVQSRPTNHKFNT